MTAVTDLSVPGDRTLAAHPAAEPSTPSERSSNPQSEPGAGVHHTEGDRPPGVPPALDELTDVVLVLDCGGVIAYANPYALRLTGHRREDVVGHSLAEFVHPRDLPRAVEMVRRLLVDGIGHPVTPAAYRLRTGAGGWVPVELNATPFDRVTGHHGADLLVIGRWSGDHAVQDRTLSRLSAGAPMADILAGIAEYGTWRLPEQQFAVIVATEGGGWESAGSAVVSEAVRGNQGAGAPWARVSAAGRPVTLELDDLPDALRHMADDEGLATMWLVPVPDPLIGRAAVALAWGDAGVVRPAMSFIVEAMARTLELVLHWRHHLVALEHAARHDPLTGAVNSGALVDLLEHEASRREEVGLIGLLAVDLDGFTEVNDEHGHAAGDDVLVEVVERLTRAVRPSDVVARTGPDEFVVLCPQLSDAAEADVIAARILAALADPFVSGGARIDVGASIGIAVQAPGPMAAALLPGLADRALSLARQSGRGTVRRA